MEKCAREIFMGQVQKWCMSLLLTFSLLELGHMGMLNCKEGWETNISWVSAQKEEENMGFDEHFQHSVKWNGLGQLPLFCLLFKFQNCVNISLFLLLFLSCSLCSCRFRPSLFLDYHFSDILVGSRGKCAIILSFKTCRHNKMTTEKHL